MTDERRRKPIRLSDEERERVLLEMEHLRDAPRNPNLTRAIAEGRLDDLSPPKEPREPSGDSDA